MTRPTNTGILIDCNVLVTWSSPATSADDRARLEHLLECAVKSKQRIIIPTPALAEFLVKTDEATTAWLSTLEKTAAVVVAPFDRAAAFECSMIDRAALGAGDKKDGRTDPWQKIKLDRQIVAIAKANLVSLIVAEDQGVRSAANRVGIETKTIAELDLPPSAPQHSLPL